MKKALSLILCLCLAAALLMGLTVEAGAETPPEERDLIILFTSTVSHIMVTGAVQEAERNNIAIERSHSSSSSALKRILGQYCA